MDETRITGIAGFSVKEHEILDWSLVLCAADIPHRVVSKDGGWMIIVPDHAEKHARTEIEAYELENSHWPSPEDGNSGETGLGLDNHPPTVIAMGALLVFHGVTGPWSEAGFWFRAGAVSRWKILENGEWWRLVTGLTLHADPVHVLGNAIIGGILVHFLCRTFGTGLGWILAIVSGALGNAINILLKSGAHNSVGFSTAVFGAAGVLSGFRIRKGLAALKGVLLPLGAGAGLLAMLGTEGKGTDLGAHLWGFTAGMGLGAVMAVTPWLSRLMGHPRVQTILFVCCLLFVYGCWLAAVKT